jgi:hypothetical protein
MQRITTTNYRARVMLIGGLLGALTGLGAAYLFMQSQQRRGAEASSISGGNLVKLGLLLFGLLRSVGDLADGTK